MSSPSSSTVSSRSASPTLSVSSGGLYVPVHKRSASPSTSSSRSFSSSDSSRTFSSGSSQIFSSRASSSSESDNVITPPKTPAFIYSRDTLLNLANSPLARLPQSQRDALRGEVPEVISNRKQRKAIEFFNQINAVQTAAGLRAPSPSHSVRSSNSSRSNYSARSSHSARSEHKPKKERAPKTVTV